MNKLPIFVGNLPPITAKAAIELALYWRVAGDAVGIIDKDGCLRYDENSVWGRPMADKSFKTLKEAFDGCESSVVKVEEHQITVDFSKLQYNLEWMKVLISKYHLGVCDSMRGLMFYQPKHTNGNLWYLESEWRFRHITVKDMNFTVNRICAISPNQENPRTAEWKTLYFAD
jgi:hypothetical protein